MRKTAKKILSDLVKDKRPNMLQDQRKTNMFEELKFTAELMVLAADIGRGLFAASRAKNQEQKQKQNGVATNGDASLNNLGLLSLQPTRQSDLANK